jgi:hypothetical protein
MKLKLKGRRLDTIDEIQAESPGVLDTDRKGLPGSVPKMLVREGPVSTCGWGRGAFSRVMAADRIYGEFYGFQSISTEYFALPLYYPLCYLINRRTVYFTVTNNYYK